MNLWKRKISITDNVVDKWTRKLTAADSTVNREAVKKALIKTQNFYGGVVDIDSRITIHLNDGTRHHIIFTNCDTVADNIVARLFPRLEQKKTHPDKDVWILDFTSEMQPSFTNLVTLLYIIYDELRKEQHNIIECSVCGAVGKSRYYQCAGCPDRIFCSERCHSADQKIKLKY